MRIIPVVERVPPTLTSVARLAAGTARSQWLRLLVIALVAGWLVAVSLASTLLVLPIGAAVVGLLVVADRVPIVALVGAFAGLFGAGSIPGHPPDDVFLALLVLACFHVGRYARLSRQPWAAAGVLALLSSNLLEPGRDVSVADAAFPVMFTGAPWLLGLAVQVAETRAERALDVARTLADDRSSELRRAQAEERLRIAQDLHDVVAHSITALSLQAQVARRQAAAGERVDVGQLRAIEQTAHDAMDDVRRLVGVLRPDEDGVQGTALPTMRELGELVRVCRSVGQQVEVQQTGTPRPLPPALDAAAYRIVQEALANARRHGGHSGRCRLHIDWTSTRLRVEIGNACAGAQPSAPDEHHGHGLLGMHERARMFGGRLQAGPEGPDWWVRAELPLVDADGWVPS